MIKTPVLVGDIGGTNARFATICLNTLKLSHEKTYACQQFDSLETVLQHYMNDTLLEYKQACIAIACPVFQDIVNMTNHHWSFSISDLKKTFHFEDFEVINDLLAQTCALSTLTQEQSIVIGYEPSKPNLNAVLIAVGTGLGVGFLIRTNRHEIPVQSEAGHMQFRPIDDKTEWIYQALQKKHGRVSIERVLSGPGIENIYQALSVYYQANPTHQSAKSIAQLAAQQDPIALETLSIFFMLLADFSGEIALATIPFGGVYLGGGILPKLLPFMDTISFRKFFNQKGRFESLMQSIPTVALIQEHSGLQGAALYLRNTLHDTQKHLQYQ